MLKLYQDLIGYEETGVSEFGLFGSDSAERFESILKSQPTDWYYRKNKVTYNRNSLGHRSTEPEGLTNFLLFLGCSITVGSAVELEKTFPYIVSSELKLNYYNLGVEGAGYDIINYNINSWFISKPKPNAIIVRWPQKERTFRIDNGRVIPIGPWSETHGIHKSHWDNFYNVTQTDYFSHYSDLFRYSLISLAASHKIPLIELKETEILDFGRDLKHPGINSHKIMAESVLKSYRDLASNTR